MYVYEFVGYVRCTACFPESSGSAISARLGIFTYLSCRVTLAVCSSLEFSKWRSAIDSRFQQLHLHLSLFYIPLLRILSTTSTLIPLADMSAGPSITSSDRMKSVDSALSSVISSLEKEQELKKVSWGDGSAVGYGQLPKLLELSMLQGSDTDLCSLVGPQRSTGTR